MTDTAPLEKALQATVERLVESRLGTLRQQLAQELQTEISAALARLPGGQAPSTTAPAAASPALATLNQSIGRILQPTVQGEVMGASLQCAAGFAGRSALFVRRGEVFAFWRAEGFRAEDVGSLRSLSVPAGQPGIFKEVSDTLQAISCPRSPGIIPPELERALGDCAEPNLHLFPVVVQGRVVAALYADAGSLPGSVEPAALEILARVTSLSLETAAGRAAALASRPAQAAGAGAEPSAGISPAMPVAEETPQPAKPSDEAPEMIPAAEGQAGPAPGSFAASIPVSSEAASPLAPPPAPDSLPDEDRDAHRKAHRFARVAVQDLLSYHKAKIEQGRHNKNLYLLLKEDIDKTRENYRQRFGKTAARSFDYFHYELVLKLAGNDPATLGPQYPGPSEGG